MLNKRDNRVYPYLIPILHKKNVSILPLSMTFNVAFL